MTKHTHQNLIALTNKKHGKFFLCDIKKKEELIKEYKKLTGIKLEEIKQENREK